MWYLNWTFRRSWITIKLWLKPWTSYWLKRGFYMLYINSFQPSHASQWPGELNPALSPKSWEPVNWPGQDIDFEICKTSQIIPMSSKFESNCLRWPTSSKSRGWPLMAAWFASSKIHPCPLLRSDHWQYFKRSWDVGVRTEQNLHIYSCTCTKLGPPPHKMGRLTWSEIF